MAKVDMTDYPKANKDVGGHKIVQSLRKITGQFLIPFIPALPLLVVDPREMKTYIHTKACTGMFTAVLDINWKQLKHSSTGGRMNEQRHRHALTLLSNGKLLIFATRRKTLKSMRR